MFEIALVGRRERSGFGQRREFAHRVEPRDDIVEPCRVQCEHRVDFAGRVAAFAQQAAQAVHEELVKRGRGFGDVRHRGELRMGRAQQHDQIDRQLLLDENAQHAERMAAQRERIFLAGRLQADTPDAGKRFELVGERDGRAGRAGGQCIAGKARLVVFGAR